MIESSIENYILLETVLGGIIILLLFIVAWRIGQIRDLLKEQRTVLTVSHIPPNIKSGDSFTISTYAAYIPIGGSASDFLRRKK